MHKNALLYVLKLQSKNVADRENHCTDVEPGNTAHLK